MSKLTNRQLRDLLIDLTPDQLDMNVTVIILDKTLPSECELQNSETMLTISQLVAFEDYQLQDISQDFDLPLNLPVIVIQR
jgi:hypothetical protein